MRAELKSGFRSASFTASAFALAVILAVLVNSVWADDIAVFPIDHSISPAGPLRTGAPIPFLFIYAPNKYYDVKQMKASITVDGRLEYNGPKDWVTVFHGAAPCTTKFTVVVPLADTSGFIVNIDAGVERWSTSRYFVTTGDSLEYYAGSIRGHSPMPGPPRYGDAAQGIPSAPLTAEEMRNMNPGANEPDSIAPPAVRTLSKEESAREELRKVELKQRLSPGREVYWIGKEIWVRDSGEFKFHKTEGVTNVLSDSKRVRDSILARSVPKPYEATLDLRDPADYEYAKRIVDTLLPTDTPGFYRVVTTKDIMGKIEAKGITYKIGTRSRPPSQESAPPDGNRKSDSTKPQGAASKPADYIAAFFDGFESTWPGDWSVQDGNPYSGYNYWGDVTSDYYDGHWSVWCADEGDTTYGTHYENDMQAVMQTTYGIDLTGFSNRNIVFYVNYDTEPDYDNLEWYESIDGLNWVSRGVFTGSSSGWVRVSELIHTTSNSYYIMFIFLSDQTVCSYPGVYIDNVSVWGDKTVLPNLTWGWPVGWDFPIVVSPAAGTHTADPLFWR